MSVLIKKNIELDFENNDHDEIDPSKSKKSHKKNIIICPCCGVLFDPKTSEVEYITFKRRYKRYNRIVYDGSDNTEIAKT